MSSKDELNKTILNTIESLIENDLESTSLDKELIISETSKAAYRVAELYQQGLIYQEDFKNLLDTNIRMAVINELQIQALSKTKINIITNHLIQSVEQALNQLISNGIDPDDPWPRS
ncbi:MAG: hypothetical protein GY858_06890 [Candidatus Omnitrophica bacterium]|nr:hypothetical protein [Candidatus Omnitrophota bacterium]